MNFDLTNTEWFEVTGLTDGKTYFLQAKIGEENYDTVRILFLQSNAVPTEKNVGLYGDCFKFTKSSKKTYIRANATPINIQVEEVS